jgi:nucleoid-associated protein YgaU
MTRSVLLSSLLVLGLAMPGSIDAQTDGEPRLPEAVPGERTPEAAPKKNPMPKEPTAAPRAQPGPAQSYVVEKGDTLAGIADKLLGDSDKWTVIARVNRIEEPEKLAVGTRLEIPEDAGQTTSDREAAVPENEPALKNQPAPDAKGN